MPRDGSGVHSLDPGYLAVTGEPVLPSNHNPPLEDLSASITESIARTGVTSITANIPFNDKKITGLGDATSDTDALNRRTADARYLVASEDNPTECRLVKDGTSLRLNRFNGSRLAINGVRVQIPSAGVTLAPTGLTPSTLYYIYAYVNSSVLTLEASTTGSATDTATGVEIKAGDATRTLVGMAYVVAGPAFADSSTQRLVASYYNRRNVALSATLATTVGVTALSFTDVSASLQLAFLSWGDEPFLFTTAGSWAVTGAASGFARVYFDGTTAGLSRGSTSFTGPQSLSLVESVTTLARGYHTANLQAYRAGGTDVQIFGTSTGADYTASLSAVVRV